MLRRLMLIVAAAVQPVIGLGMGWCACLATGAACCAVEPRGAVVECCCCARTFDAATTCCGEPTDQTNDPRTHECPGSEACGECGHSPISAPAHVEKSKNEHPIDLDATLPEPPTSIVESRWTPRVIDPPTVEPPWFAGAALRVMICSLTL